MAAKKKEDLVTLFDEDIKLIGIARTPLGLVNVSLVVDQLGRPDMDTLTISEPDMKSIITERLRKQAAQLLADDWKR